MNLNCGHSDQFNYQIEDPMPEYLLQSEVTENAGFPNERGVLFHDSTGATVNAIVPDRVVIHRNGKSYVRVKLIQSDKGLAMVFMPGELFGAGRMVTVDDSQVIPA
jgi:hypothetical protein